ncbi:MAG: hypothetical protein ACMG50_09995, partial [Thermomonas sp.]
QLDAETLHVVQVPGRAVAAPTPRQRPSKPNRPQQQDQRRRDGRDKPREKTIDNVPAPENDAGQAP